MSDILVRNISPETLELLKERAKRHNRSLQAEVKTILEEVEPPRRTPEEFRQAMERSQARSVHVWAETAGLPTGPDGTKIIRRAREGHRD